MSTVQCIGTHATIPLQGAHCALRLSKWYVLYSASALKQKKPRPPPLAVSLLLEGQKMSPGIGHCRSREEKNNTVFYWA